MLFGRLANFSNYFIITQNQKKDCCSSLYNFTVKQFSVQTLIRICFCLLYCMSRSRYTSGSAAAGGTEAEDSGTINPPVPLGCGTMFEYLILITACSILLLAVSGTTIYWVIFYQGGYDTNWIPLPVQNPNFWLNVGFFPFEIQYNSTSGGDISTTTTTMTANPAEHQPNSSYSKVSIADQRFNVHPTMMTIGFITLTGFSKL